MPDEPRIPKQRDEYGRSLREQIPLESHAEFSPGSGRPNRDLGLSGLRENFDRAIVAIAERYADQNDRDYAGFVAQMESDPGIFDSEHSLCIHIPLETGQDRSASSLG